MRSVFKLTWRSIRTFFGRYMALLLIVALSAGFFAGLKITQDAMINTGEDYLTKQNFYDFRMFSTLGFTESYILSENLVLSVIASLFGIPLGFLFHRAVMSMILIDTFAFDIHIEKISFVLAFICTVVFAVIVNMFMKRNVDKIKMAESLKAVE